MLAYRNPSNEDSDSIFNYTLKLDAYEKTAILVGFESAKRLQNNNISSCWTADANDEDLSKINQWIDLFDE